MGYKIPYACENQWVWIRVHTTMNSLWSEHNILHISDVATEMSNMGETMFSQIHAVKWCVIKYLSNKI